MQVVLHLYADLDVPSAELNADKSAFGTDRIQRWFGKVWHATDPYAFDRNE